MISASFKAPLEVFEYPIKWIPEIFHFENYVQVWTDKVIPFWRLYGNSLFIVFFSLLGQLLFASLAAYAFAKLDFKGKNVIFYWLSGRNDDSYSSDYHSQIYVIQDHWPV